MDRRDTDGLREGAEYGGWGLGLGFDSLGQLLVLPLRSCVSVVWSLNSGLTSCAHFALLLHLEYGLFSLSGSRGNLRYTLEWLLSLPGIESMSYIAPGSLSGPSEVSVHISAQR